jgi:Ca2+-binding RTX toxin-like protein
LYGGNEADFIYGGYGNDAIGGDVIRQSVRQRRQDSIYGHDGIDSIYGGTENDELHGGIGNDLVFDKAATTRSMAMTGADYLNGGTGDDYLNGSTQNQSINDSDFGHAGRRNRKRLLPLRGSRRPLHRRTARLTSNTASTKP